MNNGFVAIQRDMIDHHLLQDGDRMRAWIWLICKACWKPTKFDVHGSTITLERGQLCASIRQIADDLKWSKSAVERFLTRLETETMIERKAGQGRSIITICNYGKYQDVSNGKRDNVGTPTETKLGQQRDIKEPSNQVTSKPEPKGSRRASAQKPDCVSDEVWSDFVEHRKRHGKITPTVIAGFEREAVKAGYTLEQAMSESITQGWRGFKADWVKERSNGKQRDDKRDGVAKALDRRLGLGEFAGSSDGRDDGRTGQIRLLPSAGFDPL